MLLVNKLATARSIITWEPPLLCLYCHILSGNTRVLSLTFEFMF